MKFPYPVRDYNTGTGVNESGLDIPTTGCQVLNGSQALSLSRSRYFQYYEERRVALRPQLGPRADRAPEPDHRGGPGQGQVDLQPPPAQLAAHLGGPRLQQRQRALGRRPVLSGRAVHAFSGSDLQALHPPTAPAVTRWLRCQVVEPRSRLRHRTHQSGDRSAPSPPSPRRLRRGAEPRPTHHGADRRRTGDDGTGQFSSSGTAAAAPASPYRRSTDT